MGKTALRTTNAMTFGSNLLQQRMKYSQLLVTVLMIGGIAVGAMAVKAGTFDFLPRALVGGGSSLALPKTVTATVNTDFSVPITLNPGGASVVGVDVKITYPTDKLKLTKIVPSTILPTTLTFLPSFTQVIDAANQTGTISMSAITFDATKSVITSPMTGSSVITLANLSFTPLTDGQAPVNGFLLPTPPPIVMS